MWHSDVLKGFSQDMTNSFPANLSYEKCNIMNGSILDVSIVRVKGKLHLNIMRMRFTSST